MTLTFDPLWLYLAVALLLSLGGLAIYWFIQQNRYQQGMENLQLDLTERQQALAQAQQSVALLTQEKHQAEQSAVQFRTQAESYAERISEKLTELDRLQQRLLVAEDNENELERYINALKERVGASQAKAENLEEQLQHSLQQLSQKAQEQAQLTAQYQQVQNELTELRTTLHEKQANFEAQQRNFVEVKQQLNAEFQHLAQQILEEKSQRFDQTNQASLDALLKPFREQIEGFQKRVNEVHSESLKGTATLAAEIKAVLKIGASMSEEAQNLATALKGNNKIAGNWGEVQLESALQSAGLLAGEHYVAQESFRDQEGRRLAPDFVLHLPDNKQLILDSKVSLLAYDEAVRAEDNLSMNQALEAHCKSLRAHIEGLSKKNYANLPGVTSPDFVLMFVPIEPAYIEAMKHDPQLFNFGYERNVILVSYTTLMPILRTVANLWRIERGNHEAREISEKAGEIYNQVCVVAERLSKLGNTLNTVSNQYNQTVTSLVGRQGLIGKVERFQQLSTKASQATPQVELLSNDHETMRLESVVEKPQSSA